MGSGARPGSRRAPWGGRVAVSAHPCSSPAAGLFARLQSGGRGQRVLEVVAVLICLRVPPRRCWHVCRGPLRVYLQGTSQDAHPPCYLRFISLCL